MLLEPGDELMSEDVYADSMGGGLRRVKHNTVPMNAPIPHFRPVDGYVADLKAENERLRDAVARKDRAIEQVLGKVLGFPAYRDDPKNFPDVSPDDDSVRVGNYTAESLADMAAHDLRQYQEFVGSLPELIRETVKSYRCAAGVLLRTALTPAGGTIIREGDSEVESLCSAIVDRLCKASREMNEKAKHGTEGGE
jgi:hypothetical protein